MQGLYDPSGNARDRDPVGVEFHEAEPPAELSAIVHRWVSLRTPVPLLSDYRFHALPDACTYLIFDQASPDICGVTRLRTSSRELNLGRRFHFTNVRLLPGVWKGESQTGLIDGPYDGELPLLSFARRLHGLDFVAQHPILVELVDWLSEHGLVEPNPTTSRIFESLDEIQTVGDMAEVACLSPRQLQRVLKSTVGLAPHDFLKVIRLQLALRSRDSSSYADQSHFIRSFRSATGYTPGEFARRYDV